MKNRLIIITSFLVLLFGQTVLKALDDTLWCKYTYPTSIYAVKFTPDGQYIAAGGSDGVVTIYNAQTGDTVKSYSNGGKIVSLDISPDGKFLAFSNYYQGSYIRIYNLINDSLVKILNGLVLKFSQDGNYLATDEGIIYNTQSWSEVGHFTVISGEEIESIDISKDNHFLATANYLSDGLTSAVRLYQLNNLQDSNYYTLEQGKGSYNPRVCFSPDGNYLASEASDDTIRIWTLSDRTIYKKFCHYSEVDAIAFSPDGNYLVEGGDI